MNNDFIQAFERGLYLKTGGENKMRLEDTINIFLDRARDYLLKNLGSDNLWRDFYTKTHGESIDWVTAYIGNSLYGSCDNAILGDVAKSLADRQNKNGGWGYNHKIAPDTDSTAFAAMFLSKFDFKDKIELAKQFLLKHQRATGGFSTYNEDEIRSYYRLPVELSVEGWCAETPEITATVIQTLRKLGHTEVGKAVSYILSQQINGRWRSYWWNNDIYATVNCLKVTNNLDSRNKAEEWLINNLNEIPFYLGLSLIGVQDSEEQNKRVKRLFELQKEDGSWESYPILRFPNPGNREPWVDAGRWREDVKDQNSLFTTATILASSSSLV